MSAAGGEGENIEALFHTHVYAGTSAQKTITNGLDLSTEGGLVWTKNRNNSTQHALCSTATGVNKDLSTASNSPLNTETTAIDQFNTDGYRIAGNATNYNNSSLGDYVSWSFRKAPKFFDIVTWTGDGTTGRQIAHSLKATVGMMILKRTDSSGYWGVYHRSTDSSIPQNYVLLLNSTSARIDEQFFINDTAPTSTHFTVGAAAASGGDFNSNGATFVAYLFAHNDGDGNFGKTGDQDIIKCGSYTGNGSSGASGPSIDLGFEPQWVMIKRATNDTGDWKIFDNMRGVVTGGTTNLLEPNTTDAEVANNDIDFDSNGFNVINSNARINASGSTYIYMAIRRGPMGIPTNVRDVFDSKAANTSSDPNYPNSSASHDGFPPDMAINIYTSTGTSNRRVYDRLRGNNKLHTDSTSAQQSGSGNEAWDYMDGVELVNSSSYHAHMWRRAPSYFDVVTFTESSAGSAVTHNLGAVPEMMWVKGLNITQDWYVYHKDLGNSAFLELNDSAAATTSTNATWNNTSPTATQFTIGGYLTAYNYIAYLFATVDGISKVGSYTGNGSFQVINCGFSSSVRYVLIKRTDSTGDWCVWDTERGLTQGADPYIELNTTDQQTTGNKNYVYPDNSGFGVQEINGTNNPNVNVNNATYIFYAVAYPS